MKFTLPDSYLTYEDGSNINLADTIITVNFMDTEKEKAIGIGTSWPWDDLKNDECILH